jgi:hypothetical protein
MSALSVQVQTIFAELVERVAARESRRSIAHLSGFFSTKVVRDSPYWYFKASLPGSGQHEYYLGRETPALRRLIDSHREGRPAKELEEGDISRLCAMLRAAGANCLDVAAARVLGALADSGLFRLGAVLVGTYAFLVLGNVLGVRWGALARTQDTDIAAATRLTVAVPPLETDVSSILDDLAMGFLPVPGLDPRESSTSYKVRGKNLRVDFLTPAMGKTHDKPIAIPRFGISAAPLEMLGYLIEAPVASVAIAGGATYVNVPDAARFALHKLVLADRRPLAQNSKAVKDREQAFSLLDHLELDRPGDIDQAIDRAREKYPMVFKSLAKSARKLPGSTLRDRILTTGR